MYNIIFLTLIIVSLSVIAFIIGKKFPVLASVDVENSPKEKEARVKAEILNNRIRRNTARFSAKIARLLIFLNKKFKELYNTSHQKLKKIQKEYASDRKKNKAKDEEVLSIDIALELMDKEEYDQAEAILIKLIAVQPKNPAVFRALGQVYADKKNYTEAIQSFEHAIKLMEIKNSSSESPEIAAVYFNLAQACLSISDQETAKANMSKALSIEPENPRYLDMMIELSIIDKDKKSALSSLKVLSEVNPENGKLEEFKNRIDSIL